MMNPETTLTKQDIKNICDKYGITLSHTKRITDGFTNEVHLINDDVILKACIRTDNIDRFKVESKVLQHKDDIAKPKFIADDFSGSVINPPYILMSYVEGQSLGSIWHTLSDQTREMLISQIADSLRKFNGIPISMLSDVHELWGDSLVNGFAKSSTELIERKILTNEQAEAVSAILEKHRAELNQTPLKTVFWDIHFDNFIVKDCKLAAIIDLEAVDQMAVDYPLFVVQKQVQDPIKFLSLENEQYAVKADYAHLWRWYQKYYPEMFEAESLDERVKIYRLLDVIHLLRDWSHVKELHDQLNTYVQELR